MKKIGLLTLLIVLLTSCMSGVPVPDDKKNYIGVWQSDNVYLKISPDGYIDYNKKEGAKETSVNGPISKFENEDFVVSILGIESKFDIEKTPFVNDKGQTVMVLEGNTLVKGDSTQSNVNENKITLPTKYLTDKLVKNTLDTFNESVKAGDFTKFYRSISNLWKEQTSVKELNGIFANLIKNKDIVLKSGKGKIVYDKKTRLDENNSLIIEGHITGEVIVNFNLSFVNENGQWKLFGIDVNYK